MCKSYDIVSEVDNLFAIVCISHVILSEVDNLCATVCVSLMILSQRLIISMLWYV